MSTLILGALALVAGASQADAGSADEPRRSWVISADAVHTAAGESIEGGHVVVTDGKIAAVAPGVGGGDDDAEDALRVVAVTPGLVDLGAWMSSGEDSLEHSTETPANLRAADSLDLYTLAWDRALRDGVTAVLAATPDEAVIGGLAALVKTGGDHDVDARIVAPDCVLRGAIGSRPSRWNRTAGWGTPNHFVRRPTTRMGVEWVWRKAFYDALAAERAPEREFEGADEIRMAIRGDVPLMIGAATTQDIRTAVFLAREFSVPKLILQNAAEAWKEPDMVVASGAAVVLPPFTWNGRIDVDNAFHAWNTAAVLVERGVDVALSGDGSSSRERSLSMQPAYAMRGGLSFDEALAAVTINPARMVGADGRIGSIEVGKDADLVLWSGTPFEPTSRVVGVLLNGELVVDPR